MSEIRSCNLNLRESIIRVSLATFILIYSVYLSSFSLLFVSLFLYYTGLTRFCFVYYFFKVNETLSTKNYYLSFLPKYNPSSVFIFNEKKNLVFKNAEAYKELANVTSPQCLGIINMQKIIENSSLETIMFKNKNIFYQIQLQGIKKEKILLAYLRDVTEVMNLHNEIENTQKEIIYAMGEISETRSKETGNYIKRVALYSKELALLYGLSYEDADKLQMASPIHDIGKVGILNAILNAPRKLNLNE